MTSTCALYFISAKFQIASDFVFSSLALMLIVSDDLFFGFLEGFKNSQ